jgi:hypothetical protein
MKKLITVRLDTKLLEKVRGRTIDSKKPDAPTLSAVITQGIEMWLEGRKRKQEKKEA